MKASSGECEHTGGALAWLFGWLVGIGDGLAGLAGEAKMKPREASWASIDCKKTSASRIYKASKCIPKSSQKCKQTFKDCKCISKNPPLTSEKQLSNHLIPTLSF